ncbi:MAG: hypothetical protein Q9180_008362, partial [Flavoplaca navasiana]
TIRILITTRPIQDITRLFPGSTKLEIRATEFDLTRFLLAKLHVDSLSSKTNVKALKKALDNLPSALDELYDDALRRIKSQDQDDRKLAEKALRWVAYAYRPLSALMLQEAVAIDPEETDCDAEAIPAIELILDVCSGLLIMDAKASVVRLVHYTAQDYFNALSESEILGPHASIAAECLSYLNFDAFQNGPSSSRRYTWTRTSEGECLKYYGYTLLLYTSTFWAFHAKAGLPGPQSELGIQIRKFLMSDPRVALLYAADYDVSRNRIVPSKLTGCKGYGIAAFFGLCDNLRDLLPSVDDVDAVVFVKPNNDYSSMLKNPRALLFSHSRRTALQLAIYNDQATAVEVLLEHGDLWLPLLRF